MINRRSTPSGDGRGRGRAGGSGRGGRPAFRSGDTRGGGTRGGDSRGARGGRGDFRDDDFRGQDDSRGRPSRDSLRADRSGTRARYGRSDRTDRFDRFDTGERYERGERFRDEGRDGHRSGRRDDRYDDRYDDWRGDDRDDRRDDRRDERGPSAFRAGRGGRREDVAPKPVTSTRARYGRRDDDDRPGRRDWADRPERDRDEYGGRQERSGRRDRSESVRSGRGGRPATRTGRRDTGRRDTGRRDVVQTIGGSSRRGGSGSPQRDRVKAARQPIRDRDFYPEGYTDERDTTEVPDGVRLQKVLAQAGVASRRACEEMIGEGRVTVDGQVVRRFGAKVDPAKQVIHVDGRRIPTAPDLVYYALNKPIGVVSTMNDPQGRPCLADYVEDLAPRLFHVGRLDTETEGLLLLTNDGELANRLTHPSYGVPKKYWAKVPGPIPRSLARRLKEGVELEDGIVRVDSFSVVQEHGQQALVEVVLHEGRKHVVRRLLEAVGHRVIDLARIEFGPVKLGRTKPGTVRALTLKEVGDLYAAVKL
ncbi:pseudouridine synthase [Nonomuraea sp. NPDC052634]|uniref:pseudouridine synthase n=1 Tax=Nonomuraea sp. NPDC052634 TaxID=3155813 RepID=UPI00343E3695